MTTPDPKTDPKTDPAASDDPAGDDPAGEEPVEATREELLEQIRKKDQDNRKRSQKIKDQEKELERLRAIEEEHKSDQQKAIDEAVKEATAEIEASYQTKLLAERIMRAATGRLADPSDVILIDFATIDDPDDPKQIEKAIEDLLEAKPHLAAADGSTPTPTVYDQGPRGRVAVKNPTEGQKAEAWLRQQLTGR